MDHSPDQGVLLYLISSQWSFVNKMNKILRLDSKNNQWHSKYKVMSISIIF